MLNGPPQMVHTKGTLANGPYEMVPIYTLNEQWPPADSVLPPYLLHNIGRRHP